MQIIIPEAWDGSIQKKRNHPYFHAIIILSEILYWYRPSEYSDEATGERHFKKKFYGDFWQISMGTLSEKFDLSKDQVKTALDFLEEGKKVITRHYRTIETRTGKASNVMYIELIPEVLLALTYPEETDAEYSKTADGIFPNNTRENIDEVLENSQIATEKNSNIYTKNTTENNKENTTTTTTTEDAHAGLCDNSLLQQ